VNDDMSWNIFDIVLVAFSLFDQILSQSGVSLGDVSFARALRIFKMGKILRIFRAMRFLKELRVMVNSILGSLVSLGWSVVMLGMILYVFALFFVQQLTAFQLEGGPEFWQTELYEKQRYNLGSVEGTMLSLAMCTTGGKNWEEILLLLQPVGLLSVWAFGFYIAFFTFAVMNILTGIFVESAMQLCKPDEQEAFLLQQKQRKEEAEELLCIFETLDQDGNGRLSVDEWASGVRKERVRTALTALGVDIKDPELFFRTLATTLDIDEPDISDVISHILHMKGGASSMDLHGLIMQTVILQRSVHDLQDAVAPRRVQGRRGGEEVEFVSEAGGGCEDWRAHSPESAPPALPGAVPLT